MIPEYTTVADLKDLLDNPGLSEDDRIVPDGRGNVLVYREGLGMWLDLSVLSNPEVEGSAPPIQTG